MKKIIWALCLLATVTFAFTSCSDDDDNPSTTPEFSEGIVGYTAGAGNYGKNQGTVGAITQDNSGVYSYSGDLYAQKNGHGIGDAQDVLPIGGKIFVACTSSSKIEILDQDGTIDKTILMPNKSPRYLATDGQLVYASAYSGYVYRLNEDGIIDSVEVGSHPEAMSVANGKLYVNMSTYPGFPDGTSVSVVDLKTFKKVKEIPCALNPNNQSVTDGSDYVYIVSSFDYSRDPLVQRINTQTDQLDSLFNGALIAYNNKTTSLIVLSTAYDSSWKLSVSDYFAYNVKTGVRTDLDHSAFTSPQQVNVDPNTGNIYVIDTPDYNLPSIVYVYDSTGKLLTPTGITVGYSVQNIRFPQRGL